MKRFTVCVVLGTALALVGGCGGSGDAPKDAPPVVHDGANPGSDASNPSPDGGRSTVTVDRASGVVADGTDAVTITVTILDHDGAPISGASVAVTSSGGGNTVATSAATDANGVTTATLSSTVAETKTITVTIGAVTVAQMPTVQFVAGTATKLELGVQPMNTAAGAAISPALTVKIEDANGNVVTTSSATVSVSLGANPGNGTLSGTASLAAAAGVATFDNLSIDKAGTGYTLVASSTGLTSATSSSFSIVPGAATHLVFLSAPASTTAGTVLASTQVGIEDAYGNIVTTSTDSVTMSLGAHPTGAALSGTTTAPAQSGIATFGDLSIAMAGTGYTLVASDGALMAATGAFDIAPGPLSATASALVASPNSLAAGGTSTLTVTAKDTFGNPIAGQAVSLAASGTANTLTPASGSTNASGVFTATLSSTRAEQKMVTATLSAVQLQAPVTFTPGALSSTSSTLVASPSSLAAGGTSTLTVTAKDAFGNAIAGQSVSLAATGTANTFTPASGTTDASGVFTATLSSTKAEQKTVTATMSSLQLQKAVTFTPGALSQADSTLVASPSSLAAGGTSTLTLTAKDAFGNPIAGRSVSLTATGSANTLTPASGTTNASGVFTATLSSTKAQQKTVTATISSEQLQTTVTFTPGALSQADSTLVASPTSLTVGGSSTLTVTATDSFGNAIAGQVVSLAATGTTNTLTPASGTTNASGVFTASLSSTKAEAKQVTATMSGVQVQTTVTFTVGPLSVAHSQLWANPASLVADGKAKALITVILRDAFDNRLPGQAVTVSVGGSGNTVGTPTGTTNSNGAFFATVSSTTAEVKSLTATVGTTNITGSIAFIAPPAVCAGTPLFPSVPSVPIANTRYSNAIRTADFNIDGKPDLVTASSGSSTSSVNVALGKGNGLFQTSIQTATPAPGREPTSLEVADFNGDGKPDVAAVENTGALEIYLGSGNGSFSTVARYATGASPYGLAIGDFNGDGKLDIATADNQGHTVSILLGNGSGAFGAPTAFSTGASSTPISVVAADFDGDSKLDVAVTDDTHNTVVVLLGNGNGTFGLAFSYAVGPSPAEVISRDFNGDGHPDLAVAHHNNNPGGVSVLLGNGDGSFQPFVDHATGATTAMPYSVVATDLNGDGHWDLVAANNFSGDVAVLLGNGDGTFQANVRYTAGPSPFGIAAADFDGDGHIDIATANSSVFATALLGTGTGGFKTASRYQAGGAYPAWGVDDIATADVNADGILDLATTDNDGVSVFTGNGDGTFATQPWVSPTPFGGRHVTPADVNLDGYIDIVATLQNGPVYVLLSNGDGTFLDPIAANGPAAPTWVAVADFDRDGEPDLAVANASDSSVYVLLGNGDGTFGTASTFVTGVGPLSVVAGDFTGDGKLDLVTANEGANPSGSPGSITLLVGTGTGTFGIGQTTALPATAQVKMLSAGDVNADGKLDVVVGTSTYDLTRDGANVFLGNGNGTFGSPAVYNGGGFSSSRILLADLNGDGKLDVADVSVSDHVMSVLTGNGAGNFTKQHSYPLADYPFSGALGDFDLDGRIDFVAGNERHADPGAATVHLQSGCLP
jgi:hypothetical protein